MQCLKSYFPKLTIRSIIYVWTDEQILIIEKLRYSKSYTDISETTKVILCFKIARIDK